MDGCPWSLRKKGQRAGLQPDTTLEDSSQWYETGNDKRMARHVIANLMIAGTQPLMAGEPDFGMKQGNRSRARTFARCVGRTIRLLSLNYSTVMGTSNVTASAPEGTMRNRNTTFVTPFGIANPP